MCIHIYTHICMCIHMYMHTRINLGAHTHEHDSANVHSCKTCRGRKRHRRSIFLFLEHSSQNNLLLYMILLETRLWATRGALAELHQRKLPAPAPFSETAAGTANSCERPRCFTRPRKQVHKRQERPSSTIPCAFWTCQVVFNGGCPPLTQD